MPGNQSLALQEQDVQALLRSFIKKVDLGSPLSYATFREAWQDMHFSLVYEGCMEHSMLPGFMQSLFAVACDHLQAPLPPEDTPAAPPSECAASAARDGARDGHQLPPLQQQENSAEQQPELQGDQVAAQGQPGQRLRARLGSRPASSKDLLAAAMARRAGARAAPSIRPALLSSRPPQPGPIPRVDSAALRAMLLEEGDGEQPSPSQPHAFEQGGPYEDHIEQLVNTLHDLDLPELEPDVPHEAPGVCSTEEPAQHSPAATASQDAQPATVPSIELKVGALYAIYTLHETQPGARKVRPYIPLSSLEGLLPLAREMRRRGVPDVAAILKRLLEGNALVYGGVLRPPAGTAPSHKSQPRVAQVDMRARSAVVDLTLQHLTATQADLRELKHLQLLCDSYRSAQARIFATTDPADLPPSIADLEMGQRLSNMASEIAANVQRILKTGRSESRAGGKKMGLKSKRGSVGLDSTTQARANQEPSGLLQAVDEEVEAAAAAAGVDLPDLKGEDGVDLSGLPAAARRVELKKARERARMSAMQAVWKARGAAALAAAGDMPGSPRRAQPPVMGSPRDRPGTCGTPASPPGPPGSQQDAAAADTMQPTRSDAQVQQAATRIGGENSACPNEVAARKGLVQRCRAEHRKEEAAVPMVEQPARAGRKRRVQWPETPPEEEDESSIREDFRVIPRRPRTTPRSPGKKRAIGRSVWAGDGVEPSPTASQPAHSKGKKAVELKGMPRARRNEKEDQLQALGARKAGRDGRIGAQRVAGSGEVSSEAGEGMEGLQYDMLGLPIIPSLDEGGQDMEASVLNGSGAVMEGGADDRMHVSDVSDDEDVGAAPSAVPAAHDHHPEHRPAAQTLHDVRSAGEKQPGQAVSNERPSQVQAGGVNHPARPASAVADGEVQEVGSQPVSEKEQEKRRKRGTGHWGVQPSGAKAGKFPGEGAGSQAGAGASKSDRPPSSRSASGSEPGKVVDAAGNYELSAETQEDHNAASAAQHVQHPTAVASSEEAAQPLRNCVKAGRASGKATVPRSSAKGSALGFATAARPNAVPAKGNHAPAGNQGAVKNCVPANAAGRAPMTAQQNGHEKISRKSKGVSRNKGPVDWSAFAKEMADLAAQADALLAEEEDV